MNYESENDMIGINSTPFEELSWSIQQVTWPSYEEGICNYNCSWLCIIQSGQYGCIETP